MTWFKVDDGFYDHPKVRALEEGGYLEHALALWVVAGSWCARYLTDGAVPARQVTRFGMNHAAADELVRARLWVKTPDGYAFWQWSEHQPTRDQVQTKRRATNARVARHRNGEREPVGNAVTSRPVTALHGQSNALPGIRARSPDLSSTKTCDAVNDALSRELPPSQPQPSFEREWADMQWLDADDVEKRRAHRREVDAFDKATGTLDACAPRTGEVQ